MPAFPKPVIRNDDNVGGGREASEQLLNAPIEEHQITIENAAERCGIRIINAFRFAVAPERVVCGIPPAQIQTHIDARMRLGHLARRGKRLDIERKATTEFFESRST